MPDGREKARALLAMALKTYAEEIRPDLPAAKRYAGAMAGNAMAVALRALQRPAPETLLLERIAGDEPADLAALAEAIRAGAVSDASHPVLRQALMDYVTAELEINNPRFLKRRRS